MESDTTTMHLQAFTLPHCPNCDGKETAIGHPKYGTWFCFNCHSSGEIEYTVTNVQSVEA